MKKNKTTLSHYNMLMTIHRQLFLSVLGLILCWDKKVFLDPKEVTPVNINWESSVRISNSSFFPGFDPRYIFSRQTIGYTSFNLPEKKYFFKTFFFLWHMTGQLTKLLLKPSVLSPKTSFQLQYFSGRNPKLITIILHSCFAITLAIGKRIQTFQHSLRRVLEMSWYNPGFCRRPQFVNSFTLGGRTEEKN